MMNEDYLKVFGNGRCLGFCELFYLALIDLARYARPGYITNFLNHWVVGFYFHDRILLS